jgi:hypothetical protein
MTVGLLFRLEATWGSEDDLAALLDGEPGEAFEREREGIIRRTTRRMGRFGFPGTAGGVELTPNVVTCPHCGTKNRVGASADGVSRCGNCQNYLPWIVDADRDERHPEAVAGS